MSVDYRGFQSFSQKLQNLDVKKIEDIALSELCARILATCTKRTPVGVSNEDTEHIGGQLRKEWNISKLAEEGAKLIRRVYNPTEYASYVEYGHRQEVGRFVPVLGKRLKQPWVNGKFIMTRTVDELLPKADKIVQSVVDRELIKELKT